RGLLKQACYALRRDLQAPELFRGSIQLRLNPAVISSDVGSFAASLEQNDPIKAVSLYTAPFLDGFYLDGGGEFEAWAEAERARLASQCRGALEAIAAAATKRGEHREAVDWWRRILALDPLSSHAALGLMTALDQAGERAEALRCAAAYGELVRSELGADPPPELSAWIEQHHHVAGVSKRALATRPAPVEPFAPAGATPVRRSRLATRRWGVAVGLVALAGAGVLLFRSRPTAPTDPNLLAIAPFDVLDPSLQIWHEGLVDILSRDLDGAGPLRTVPQTVGLHRWQGRADRVSAESFGHRTGAGLVVFGSVGKARDTLSLRATVLDLVRNRVEPDLEVKGDTADIGNLADSLGLRILQVLGRDRPIAAVRQERLGSRSFPALKAFLYGEQFYRRGLWDSALVYYDQAIAHDSTFAIAYRHMRVVLDWHPSSSPTYRPTQEYLRKSLSLNHGLSPKDSMLIAADSFETAANEATDPANLIRFRYRKRSILEEAGRRYPGDPEVWYEVGDQQFHDPPPLGGVPAPALEAFDRAIALDPGFAPAYEHTVELALRLNRPDLARTYAAAYLRLDPTDVNAPAMRLSALLLDPERSHIPETVQIIDSIPAWVLFDAATSHIRWWTDSGEAAIRLLRALNLQGSAVHDGWDAAMNPQFLAYELVYRGHLQEAYAVDRSLLHTPGRLFWNFFDPFRALALLGAVPESLSAETFGQALEPGRAWWISPYFTDRRLQGLPWWLARRDTASLARFVRRAEREARLQRNGRGKLQSRYLHAAATAYLALARADSVRALRLFQSIPDTLCIVNDCSYEKLIEARLLTSQGEARQAAAILDRWVWSGEGPLFVLGVMERARSAETLGERQKAMDSYQYVADVWRRADPELQHFVVEARNALARLRRE
ncbi:MAG TPA: BTAD domain-containing putative transcriptional regulator, partial [Gemmatimonadales bacterium]|nr:BTAD domain-containing putative transcriptional regulator [Gemmatimonadales bacterium]